MKIFYLQNIGGATGPAMVDKKLFPHLNCRICHFSSKPKILRAIEIVFKLIGCKCAIMSSMSRFNKLVIKISKLLGIKTIYFMHGCAKQESQINGVPYDAKDIEEYSIANCDRIICVSDLFRDYVVENMGVNREKIDVVYNGIEIGKSFVENSERKLSIISTGGSVPRKNNIAVCLAVEKIIDKYPDLKYTIVHNDCYDEGRKEIECYPFVNYLEVMPQEDLFKLMATQRIYIQNSTFETFCLAIAEAVNQGCDVLSAKNIGINELIKIPKEYIIKDNNDIDEIASKIEYTIANSNHDMLIANIDEETMGWKACAKNILQVVENEVKHNA